MFKYFEIKKIKKEIEESKDMFNFKKPVTSPSYEYKEKFEVKRSVKDEYLDEIRNEVRNQLRKEMRKDIEDEVRASILDEINDRGYVIVKKNLSTTPESSSYIISHCDHNCYSYIDFDYLWSHLLNYNKVNLK